MSPCLSDCRRSVTASQVSASQDLTLRFKLYRAFSLNPRAAEGICHHLLASGSDASAHETPFAPPPRLSSAPPLALSNQPSR